MGIEGRVKIELRDAITGEVIDTREEHNQVTDAVYNVINGAVARARKGNYAQLQLGSQTEDIIKQLFGGVMIFSENIDTSHLVPSADEMMTMIGNGNQQSPITGSGYKGTLRSATYNSDYSEIEFIWDFSSTQCNGTIAAICLTSNKGGELGCRVEARDTSRYSDSFVYAYSDRLGYDENESLSASYPNTNILNLIGGDGNDGLRLLDGKYLVAYRGDTKYTWDLSKYKNRFDFNENQTTLPEIQATIEQVTTEIPGYTGNVEGNLIHGPMTDYALKGKCVYTTNNDNTTYTLQLTKCTKTSQSTINVPMNNIITAIKAKYDAKGCAYPDRDQTTCYNINNSLANCCFTWDNKLIWLVGSYNNSDTDFLNIYIQEYDGSYVVIDTLVEDTVFYNLIDKTNLSTFKGVLYGADNIFSDNSLFDIAVVDDAVYMRARDYFFLMCIDDEASSGVFMDNRPSFYVYNSRYCFSRLVPDIEFGYTPPTPENPGDPIPEPPYIAKLPFYRPLGNAVSSSSADSNNWCVNSLLRTNYLATIQIQSNPAIKTPSHVMSITYTLTRT